MEAPEEPSVTALSVLNKMADQSVRSALVHQPERKTLGQALRLGMVPLRSDLRLAWDLIGLLAVILQSALVVACAMMTHRCHQDELCHADAPGTWLAWMRNLAVSVEAVGAVFFTLDMIVNLRTTYFEADGVTEVIDSRRCAMNYVTRGAFVFDLLCVLPLGKFLEEPISLKKDELTGARRFFQSHPRLRAWWQAVRESKLFKKTKGLVKGLAKAPTNIKKHGKHVAMIGVSNVIRITRVLLRLKIIKVLVVVIRESKFVVSFLKRMSNSERAMRTAVTMYKMKWQHHYISEQQKAIEKVQARVRGKLARRFVLRMAEQQQADLPRDRLLARLNSSPLEGKSGGADCDVELPSSQQAQRSQPRQRRSPSSARKKIEITG
jgi:hypothetical protein